MIAVTVSSTDSETVEIDFGDKNSSRMVVRVSRRCFGAARRSPKSSVAILSQNLHALRTSYFDEERPGNSSVGISSSGADFPPCRCSKRVLSGPGSYLGLESICYHFYF